MARVGWNILWFARVPTSLMTLFYAFIICVTSLPSDVVQVYDPCSLPPHRVAEIMAPRERMLVCLLILLHDLKACSSLCLRFFICSLDRWQTYLIGVMRGLN